MRRSVFLRVVLGILGIFLGAGIWPSSPVLLRRSRWLLASRWFSGIRRLLGPCWPLCGSPRALPWRPRLSRAHRLVLADTIVSPRFRGICARHLGRFRVWRRATRAPRAPCRRSLFPHACCDARRSKSRDVLGWGESWPHASLAAYTGQRLLTIRRTARWPARHCRCRLRQCQMVSSTPQCGNSLQAHWGIFLTYSEAEMAFLPRGA